MKGTVGKGSRSPPKHCRHRGPVQPTGTMPFTAVRASARVTIRTQQVRASRKVSCRAEGSKVTREFNENDGTLNVPKPDSETEAEPKMNPDGTYYADELPVRFCFPGMPLCWVDAVSPWPGTSTVCSVSLSGCRRPLLPLPHGMPHAHLYRFKSHVTLFIHGFSLYEFARVSPHTAVPHCSATLQ